MSVNGIVRPCSRPTSDRCWEGAPKKEHAMSQELESETRSVLLSIQSKSENVMETKIAPRWPRRRGRQTQQAKDRLARPLGSCSVLPNDVGFSREVRCSAALMRYLNSRIESCYIAPIIWVFAPKYRETGTQRRCAVNAQPPNFAVAVVIAGRAAVAGELTGRRDPGAAAQEVDACSRRTT
jgi:hypothetical protein